METERSIESPFGLAFIIVFIVLLFLLLRQIFKKGIIHFRLLKELYPNELEGINSYLKLMWISNSFKLNIGVMLWFWIPFYYCNISIENLSQKGLIYHNQLKRNNRFMILFFLMFFVLMLCGWILISIYGE